MSWKAINDADNAIEDLRKRVKIVKKKRELKSIHELSGQDEVTYRNIFDLAQRAFVKVIELKNAIKKISADQQERYIKKFTAIWEEFNIGLGEADLRIKKNRVVPAKA